MIAWAYNTRFRVPFGGKKLNAKVSFAISEAQDVELCGDSVTKGAVNPSGSPDPTFAWHVPFRASVAAAFTGAGKTPPTFTIVATGGFTTTDWLQPTNIAAIIAAQPDHLILLIGVNDQFNHGGTPIPPATSAANLVSGLNQIWTALPACRVHLMTNLWGSSEHFPDGSNPEDAAIDATNAAEFSATSSFALVKQYAIRSTIFSVDEPAQNPGNVATGQLIQNGGGYHPTKVANPPATLDGQQVVSNHMFALVPLNLS